MPGAPSLKAPRIGSVTANPNLVIGGASVTLTATDVFEPNAGGNIALIEEGDPITIDARKLLVELNVSEVELARRRARWKPPAPRYTRGVLAKYMKLVSTASIGAITDRGT